MNSAKKFYVEDNVILNWHNNVECRNQHRTRYLFNTKRLNKKKGR